jgi:hypothetical protein
MALGLAQPLTEMNTMKFPVMQLVCKANNLTAICEPIIYKMWEPQVPFTGIDLLLFNFDFFWGGDDDEGNVA